MYIYIQMEPQVKSQSKAELYNLSYFQFAALPDLFTKYLDQILSNNDLQTIRNIFSSFLMTLIEHSSHLSYQIQYLSEIPNANNITIQNITASPLTYQLFVFLKQIMVKLPIGELPFSQNDLKISYHPKLYFYQLILDQVIKDKQNILKETSKQNEFQYTHNKTSIAYFLSLRGYYAGVQAITQIKMEQKINQKQIQLIIQCYQSNYHMFINTNAYQKYRISYSELIKKLKYVMNALQIQNEESMLVENNKYQLSTNKKNMQEQLKPSLSEFYYACYDNSEKQQFITNFFMERIQKKNLSTNSINQLEILTFYHLQSLQSLQQKVNMYVYLLALKILRTQEIDILNQFTTIHNICNPSLNSILCLAYSLFSVPYDPKIAAIMQGILKICPKPQTKTEQENSSYLQLVILTLLVFRLKLKVANRKQIIEKILQIPEILNKMNNIRIIDFLIGLIFYGKQIEFNLGLQNSDMVDILNSEDYENAVRKYLVDGISNEATANQKPQQLLKVLKLLVKRRLYLSYSVKSKFLQLLLMFLEIGQQKSNKAQSIQSQMSSITLKNCLKIVCQMSILDSEINMNKNGQQNQNSSVIQFAYSLLYWNLCVCGYYLQALVCLQVGLYQKIQNKKVSYIGIYQIMKGSEYYYFETFMQSSLSYSSRLVECLVNYDIIEIIMEICNKNQIYSMASNWLNCEQNYETMTFSRRDKKIEIKRNRFLGILWDKFIKVKI